MPNNNNNQSTNNNDQTKTDDQTPIVSFPPVDEVLPPMPQASQQDVVNPSPADTGSAAPSDDVIMPQVIGTTPPKKKFAGGKVIATILGLFLLVGGVGAGVFLTSENQNINEEAGAGGVVGSPCIINSSNPAPKGDCNIGLVCHCQDGQACTIRECEEPSTTQAWCEQQYPNRWCVNSGGQGMTCCACGYVCGAGGIGCVLDSSINCGTETTPPGPGPSCINAIVLYNAQESMITDLSTLKVGQKVFLTIPIAYGANNTLNFTKARFTVNGVLRPEVTAHKKFQVADVFYDSYTVTSGTTNVQAEVYYNGVWYGK